MTVSEITRAEFVALLAQVARVLQRNPRLERKYRLLVEWRSKRYGRRAA